MKKQLGAYTKSRRKMDKVLGSCWPMRIAAAVIIVTWLQLTWWLYYPYKPFVLDKPVHILNAHNEVVQGGLLRYALHYDKRLPIPATITKQLVNTFLITATPLIGNIAVGKGSLISGMRVPARADVGTYVLKWEAAYQVNHFRKIIVSSVSEPFQVIAAEPCERPSKNSKQGNYDLGVN